MSAIFDIVLAIGVAVVLLGMAYACLETPCRCQHCRQIRERR